MFKVLIVDDEPTIREGLAALIPWEEYGFNQVETAGNGGEAIKKHEQLLPSLMIVDIKMPGMSGIELIEEIRKRDSFVHFIILSGYAEFEYAKKAISFGVEGYLLKPIVEEELISYLESLRSKMKAEKVAQQYEVKVREETKEWMIQTVLSGKVEKEAVNYFEQLEWKKYRLLLLSLDESLDGMKCKQKLKEKFEEREKTGIVFTYKRYLGVIMNGQLAFHNSEHLYEQLKLCISSEQGSFTAAFTDTAVQLKELANAYQTSALLISRKFFYDEDTILTPQSKPVLPTQRNGDTKQKSCQSNATLDKLFYTIELADLEEVENICLEIASQLIQENPSEEWIKQKFVHLISILVNRFLHEYQEISGTLTSIVSNIIEIEKQPTIGQLLSCVNALLAEIVEQMDGERSDMIVKKMMRLIERHYHSNIKLDTLAETLNYHRAYLGKLFKEQTGEYFNTYLDKVRIENGKRLLLQDLKIYQVAERIGYANVDYFHSKFKKYVGMPPTEYRKNKMKEKSP
ncbi:response regulator transcription factor [Bacillus sp. SD088]|uniref:response regulator transcription factor n=1 Tax=Bacillus sp. SD088 TaxID=2782012 RepID=UPI001A9789B0|nr:response regulator transcription factor [Bacillus sp. SD088]MBO0992218.1 response regulator transcription factor [Bacillus sp. SD088]